MARLLPLTLFTARVTSLPPPNGCYATVALPLMRDFSQARFRLATPSHQRCHNTSNAAKDYFWPHSAPPAGSASVLWCALRTSPPPVVRPFAHRIVSSPPAFTSPAYLPLGHCLPLAGILTPCVTSSLPSWRPCGTGMPPASILTWDMRHCSTLPNFSSLPVPYNKIFY